MALIIIVFVLAFVGLLVAALLVDGVYAFYLYQLVYFLNPANRWWGSSLPDISYSYITVVFMFVALLLHYKKSASSNRLAELPLSKWILAILVMYAVMYFLALSPEHHWQALIEFTKLIIIISLAYKLINTEKKLDMALWAYIIGATYIGYVATGFGRGRGVRLEGIGTIDSPDSNGTAALLGPALIFLIYFAWFGNKYAKIAAVVCGAFIANGVVLLNSRGTFLAIFVGALIMICYMLFSKYQRAGQRGLAVILIAAGLGGTVYVTDEAFWERMVTLKQITEEEGDRGGAHRMEFWFATFDIMVDYPLGVGVRGYNLISSRYIDPSLTKGGRAFKSVHSSWFQVLAEIGWPGPILIAGLFFSCYRLSKQTKKYLIDQNSSEKLFKMIAIETALLTFIVAASFINRIRAELLYWLILFLACGANVFYLQVRASTENATNKVKSIVSLIAGRSPK